MNINKWLSTLPQFLILLPAAASCYLCLKNRLKYTPAKTAVLCLAVLVPYSLITAALCAMLQIDMNFILLPSLVLFFFLYRRTVTIGLSQALAIYIGVCAIETFPAQFAYAFDAYLYPSSGAADFSTEAALFQFGLSLLLLAVFAYPACHRFSRAVEQLDFPKIWYSTAIVSFLFLVSNILMTPISYSTLQAGRLSFLFPFLEGCALAVLVTVYLLFYRNTMFILENIKLREHSQLLEMQAHQYRTLQGYIKETSRLRHDFRHSLRLLASLAEKGDLESIRSHLTKYELELSEGSPVNYCANPALNALFGYYHEMALSAGIETDWNIELPQQAAISELDMAALFGNLMENAIAGCQTLQGDKKYFCLSAQARHENSLYIVSTNNFDGKVRKGKDGYHSTRHSGKGTGLSSIAAVAEKYNGSARFSNNEKEFYADVMLKISR